MCEVCHGHPNCPVCSPEPRMIECAACQGQGYVWYRYDLEENRETEVTEKEFNALPADETEAIEKGLRYCQGGNKRVLSVTERARLKIMNFMNPNGTIDL